MRVQDGERGGERGLLCSCTPLLGHSAHRSCVCCCICCSISDCCLSCQAEYDRRQPPRLRLSTNQSRRAGARLVLAAASSARIVDDPIGPCPTLALRHLTVICSMLLYAARGPQDVLCPRGGLCRLEPASASARPHVPVPSRRVLRCHARPADRSLRPEAVHRFHGSPGGRGPGRACGRGSEHGKTARRTGRY